MEDKSVTVTSSDTSIATVNGLTIIAKNAGTATITAKSPNGITDVCTVIVKVVNVEKVNIEQTSVTLNSGETATLAITVSPGNATNTKVTLTSSNPSIVTVNGFTITAKNAGSATITATSINEKADTCIIKVLSNKTLDVSTSPIEIQVKKFVPVLDGIVFADEYPADSWFVLDKATTTAYNGIWIGEMTDDLHAKYNFAWAADGLYAAFVAVDNTPDPATSWDVHGQNGGPLADGFQLSTGNTWITIGAYADGTLSPRNHTGAGEEVDGLTNIVTGKATRKGNIFTVEAFIPWIKLLDYEAAQDSVIPILFTYMDRADGAENVCYKSIDVAVWDATVGDISLKVPLVTYTP